jgi:hypothetical protein
VGYHSLTTTSHPSNVSLPSSRQQSTARLSARKVSVARATGPKTLWTWTLQGTRIVFPPEQSGSGMIPISHIHLITRLTNSEATPPFPPITSWRVLDNVTFTWTLFRSVSLCRFHSSFIPMFRLQKRTRRIKTGF